MCIINNISPACISEDGAETRKNGYFLWGQLLGLLPSTGRSSPNFPFSQGWLKHSWLPVGQCRPTEGNNNLRLNKNHVNKSFNISHGSFLKTVSSTMSWHQNKCSPAGGVSSLLQMPQIQKPQHHPQFYFNFLAISPLLHLLVF